MRRKRSSVRARKSEAKRTRTTQRSAHPVTGFFKAVGVGLFVVISAVLILYFFVLPSLLQNKIENKNILLVSSKLDVQSNYLYIAHISIKNEENALLVLDSQNEVELPHGYGKYPLQSVYQLLLLDKKDSHFIQSVYSELFGFVVDEVVALDIALKQPNESELASFFLKAALNNAQQFRLNSMLQALALHYQAKEIAVSQLSDISDLESEYADLSTLQTAEYQYCSVAVVNATGENGVASDTAEVFENTGALVIRIDDTVHSQEETQIFYADDPVDCTRVAEKMGGIFPQKPEMKSLSQLENAQQYRSKVVVIIGKQPAN